MAKITREPQSIFCGSHAALPDYQIAVFGSAKAGTPAYSGDPSAIQAAAYLTGWADAAVNNKAPTLQEMNGLFYVSTYQIAYLLQTGVPEYHATTTYFVDSVVNYGSQFYICIADGTGAGISNVVPTTVANWKPLVYDIKPYAAGVAYATGEIVRSTDGLILYAAIADGTGDTPASSPAKWRPILQNGTAAASGGTTTATCDGMLAKSFTCASTGNITITVDHMQDGEAVNILLTGVAARTVAWTLKKPNDSALTPKTGITYSNTMTGTLSLFTLLRVGDNVVINSLHGIA